MKLRRRSSRLPRAPWPNGIERTEPLRGQLWTRSEKSLKPPDVHWGWRVLAVGAAGLEISLLVWLLLGPAFALRSVDITGSRHLTASQVEAAAGISSNTSLLSIDSQSARNRLQQQVWVRTATVETRLPGTVLIHISEWDPVAAYHAGSSAKLYLLSSQAVVLGPSPSAGGLVDIQGPASGDPRIGERALDPVLLTALVNIQRDFPTLLGQDVAGFIFDSCGNLTLV